MEIPAKNLELGFEDVFEIIKISFDHHHTEQSLIQLLDGGQSIVFLDSLEKSKSMTLEKNIEKQSFGCGICIK